MRLDVDQIPDTGLTFEQAIPQDAFGIEFPDKVLSKPVTASLKVSKTGEQVWVTGFLAGELRLACSRCTKPFHQDFRIPFSALYVPRSSDEPDDVDVDPEDDSPDYIRFEGDRIELLNDLQQSIILDLPIKPVCRETCRGLCPKCGINLNLEQCDCGEEPRESPFAKLKELRQKLQ